MNRKRGRQPGGRRAPASARGVASAVAAAQVGRDRPGAQADVRPPLAALYSIAKRRGDGRRQYL